MNNVLESLIYFSDIFSCEALIHMCRSNIDAVVIVTDENVGRVYAEKMSDYLASNEIKTHTITVPVGEHSKTREKKSAIEDQMFALGCGRDTLIIALGGGVITDLAGFVAATYCRGIPAIYIPTSLLAMVDASIGGKTGINTSFGKNTIGTFTHPRAVFIDMSFLKTLSDTEYLSGLFEMIKHAAIYDEAHFKVIEMNLENIMNKSVEDLDALIKRSCEIKMAIVRDDEKENNKREMLNFGHTVGHAIEHVSQYDIAHGYAVGLGMIAEACISNKMGHLHLDAFNRIRNVICEILENAPFTMNVKADDVMDALRFDKKNRKQQSRFVMIKNIGEVFQVDNVYAHHVDEEIVREAIGYL